MTAQHSSSQLRRPAAAASPDWVEQASAGLPPSGARRWAPAPSAAAPRIGDFIRETRSLSDSQIEEILLYQRQHVVRFGEAAERLNLVSRDDVLQALAKQFQVPLAHTEAGQFAAELVTACAPFGEAAEHFRELRSQLLTGVLAPAEPGRALAVLSAMPKEGKSFFAANLAVSLSQIGARTLLIDGNLRQPRLHEMFGLSGSVGLSELLAGQRQGGIVDVPGLPGLHVLPGGQAVPNALELLERPTFSLLLHEWLLRYEHVVVDTPASSEGSLGRVFAAKCGASLIVARPGRTAMRAVEQLAASLQRSQTVLAGVVLNER